MSRTYIRKECVDNFIYTHYRRRLYTGESDDWNLKADLKFPVGN